MNGLYQYSIIRFQPFADLGEFANIGIIAFDVSNNGLDFRLARKRFRRLREFFGDDAYRAYAAAIDHLRTELSHVAARDGFWASWEPAKAFAHLTRRHEAAIVFSGVRTLVSEHGLETVIDALFGRLIERQRQEAHDLDLIRDIRQELVHNGIRGFRAIRVDDAVVPVTFPLAHRNGHLKAIHPLVFNQKTPLAVFDFGAMWRRRFTYLLDRGRIDDDSVLIAFEPPAEDVGLLGAFGEAMGEMAALPFETVSAEIDGKINRRIVEFAEQAAPRSRALFN